MKYLNIAFKIAWIVLGVIGAATVVDDVLILWSQITGFFSYMAELV